MKGAGVAAIMLLAPLAPPLATAEALCAYRTESGALVYTNTPTKDGRCAPPSATPVVRSAAKGRVAKFDATIQTWSRHYGVPSHLVHAVIATESAYNPLAVSPKGARGLMQLMPQTARRYGVSDPFNVEQNIRGGVAHLRDLLDFFSWDLRLALAAYNAGQEAVLRHTGVPPFTETQQYVRRVLSRYGGGSAGRSALAVRSAGEIRVQTSASGTILLVN